MHFLLNYPAYKQFFFSCDTASPMPVTLAYFFIISSYTQFFLKNVFNIKCVWVFYTSCTTNYSHSTKNFVRHYQKCTSVLMLKCLKFLSAQSPKRKFYENLFIGSQDVPHRLKYEQKGGWGGKLTWLGSHFSQLCQHA